MTGEDVARRGRARVGLNAVQASMAAIAFAIATPAAAECVTDASGNVVCADTVANGVTLQKNNASLTVSEGAQVSAGSSSAGIVNTGYYTQMTISGDIDGGARPGILVEGGALTYVPCDPYAGASPVNCTPGAPVPSYKSSSSTITINAGASVTGSSAILLSNRAPSDAIVFASIDNAGTLIASNGPALVAGDGTEFDSIQNRATGFIGGIAGAGRITNAGMIDGGSNSAIFSPVGGVSLDNSGMVRSAGSGATFVGGYVYGTNSGTIRNDGAGAAITSADSITFTNEASGIIASSGTVAIRAGGVITLTNQGTIRGSVIAGTDPYGYNASLIDTRTGTITGDVRLGAGNDTVMARYDGAAGRITSIGGTIDAGAGSNLLQLDIDGSATFGQGTLPGSFDRFGFGIANGATVTVGEDFTGIKAITASGNGTLVNAADLTTNGTAITTTYSAYEDRLDVVNTGTIIASPTSPYLAAVSVSYGSLTNSGTIRSTGLGVNVSNTSGGALTNSGTIAGTTGGAVLSYVDLINSGSITASAGTGVSLFRASATGSGSTNSGTISGATTGISAYDVTLANSGTITGGTTGLVIDQSEIDNLAGGVITGGTNAIDGGSGYYTVVRNAGTINGNVSYIGFTNSSHLFIDNGGAVNGAIRFGDGNDTLVVNLIGTAGRALAGATGGVQAGGGFDTIRYVAGKDASAAITVADGFDAAAYEVTGDAALKLTSAAPLSYTLGLSGTGKIDVTADIAVNGVPAIDLAGKTSAELMQGWFSVGLGNPDLAVISHGAISVGPATDYYSSTCAVNADNAAFENAGSITVTNGPIGSYNFVSGICGGQSVTNSGIIRLTGGAAIVGAASVTNTGSIVDVAGSGGSGINGAATVVNTGQITVDGVGVQSGYGLSLSNAGTIESRQTYAVDLGFGGTLVNAAGGTIKGADTAVVGVNASISNSGTIVGDVVLNSYDPGVPANPSVASANANAAPAPAKGSRYEAAGGTIIGNLMFGDGNDQFIQTTASTGVSGFIDGGNGTDTFTLAGSGAGSGSGTFKGASNFERLDVASGSWTLGTPAIFRDGTGIASGATLIGTSATLLGAIDVGGTLRIDQSFDGELTATLNGDGALVKAGSGSVSMQPQLGFIGNISVVGGRLLFFGNSLAQVSVANATFAGTGSVGSLAVGTGGVVSPGDAAIGTLTVQGDFSQAAGSTYFATLAANGASDRIVAAGTATLAPGAGLAIGGTAGTIGTRYTLLSAAGGVQGRYALLQQAEGLTEIDLAYSATDVFADVVRSRLGLSSLAVTANQRGVAVGLSGLTSANATYAALVRNADDDGTRAAFDLLSGEVHASIRTAMVQDARIVEGAVLTRTLVLEPGSGVWGTIIGNRGTDDGDSNAAQVSRSTFGGVGGVDLGFDGARIGLAGGYTRTNVGIDAPASTARIESYHVMGYGAGQFGPISVRAGIGYAWTDNRTTRNAAVPGAGQTLRASYGGNVAHSFGELAYVLPVAEGSVQPLLGFEAFRVHGDRFAEAGGSAALSVAARTESFAFAKAGLRFQTPIVEGLSARATTAWVRRVDGTAPSVRANFATAATSFDVSGSPLSQDGLTSSLDLTFTPAENFRIVSSYSGMIGGQGTDSSFRLSAALGF